MIYIKNNLKFEITNSMSDNMFLNKASIPLCHGNRSLDCKISCFLFKRLIMHSLTFFTISIPVETNLAFEFSIIRGSCIHQCMPLIG